MTEESARIMLKRGLKRSGDGFVFTRDLRHKVPSLYGFTDEYLEEFAKNLSCPHLLIKVVRCSLGRGMVGPKINYYFIFRHPTVPTMRKRKLLRNFSKFTGRMISLKWSL